MASIFVTHICDMKRPKSSLFLEIQLGEAHRVWRRAWLRFEGFT